MDEGWCVAIALGIPLFALRVGFRFWMNQRREQQQAEFQVREVSCPECGSAKIADLDAGQHCMDCDHFF